MLHNLEASYNQRNHFEYDRLIDTNFNFFFSPEDFSSGRTPETWDRSTDVPATGDLFIDGLTIDLDIQIDSLEWAAIIPDSFPDETWFMTTATYTFTMRFGQDPETTWITSGQPRARYTVREVDAGGTPEWRLVECNDLGGLSNLRMIIPPGSPRTSRRYAPVNVR